jgi:hypothetical protein
MLRLLAILSMLLFTTSAFANVCSFITKEQAELGAKLLQINPNLVKYCATCPEKSKTKIRVEKVEALPVGHEQKWALFVNEENIDLANAYLDIGENNGINLAKLSGCETPSNIPERIDLSEVTVPATTESKTSAPVEPKTPAVAPAPVAEPKTPAPAEAPAPTPESKTLEAAEPAPNPQPPAHIPPPNPLHDADQYFQNKDFNAAVRLYEDYVEKNPSEMSAFNPKIAKCYYNLGVQTIQKAQTRKDCGVAADYFTHCLFLDQSDALASEGLRIANLCREMGPNLPKLQSEIEELEFQK